MDHLCISHSVPSATGQLLHPLLTASNVSSPFCPNRLPHWRGRFPVRKGVSLNTGISLMLLLPCPRVQVPSRFLSSSFSLLFFILPSYAVIFIVLSSLQGLLLVLIRCSVRVVSSIDVFLMHLWREMNSTSFYSSAILTPSYTIFGRSTGQGALANHI